MIISILKVQEKPSLKESIQLYSLPLPQFLSTALFQMAYLTNIPGAFGNAP